MDFIIILFTMTCKDHSARSKVAFFERRWSSLFHEPKKILVASPGLRFHLYSFLLMKTLPVHIAPFLIKCDYAMNSIGVHTLQQKQCCLTLFSKQTFLFLAVNWAPIASLNAIIINPIQGNAKCFQMSLFLAFTSHWRVDRFQNTSFSDLSVFH